MKAVYFLHRLSHRVHCPDQRKDEDNSEWLIAEEK